MKLFKSSILAAVAIAALGFSFTSCEEENEYVVAPTPVGAYFTQEAAQPVDLTADGTSFDVKVMRSGETVAATYNISSTCMLGDVASTAFTIPASVSFAENATEANLTISYNGSTLAVGDEYTVTLKLEGDKNYAYAANEVTFTAGIPEPWSEWQPFDTGLCSYIFGLGLLSPDTQDAPIYYRQNLNNPTQAQIMLEWLYLGGEDYVYMTLDWNTETDVVRLPMTNTGLTDVDGNYVYVCDYATYAELNGRPDIAEEVADYSFYDELIGQIQICLAYVSEDASGAYSDVGYETIQLNGYDLGVELAYKGCLITPTEEVHALFTATVGGEATSARIACMPGKDGQAVLDAIEAGTVEYQELKSGVTEVELPIKKSGEHTAVLVSYKDDVAADAVAYTFTYAGGEPNNWKPVGQGYIEDGWFTFPFTFTTKDEAGNTIELGYKDLGWTFDVEENEETPGVYRMRDVWTGESTPLVQVGVNMNTESTHVIIDLTNEQCVKIAPQYSGLTTDEFSTSTEDMFVLNYAGFYSLLEVSDEDLIKEGMNQVVEDGFIEFLDAPFSFGAPETGEDLLQWKAVPDALIYFPFLDPNAEAAAPAKVISNNDALDFVSYKKKADLKANALRAKFVVRDGVTNLNVKPHLNKGIR